MTIDLVYFNGKNGNCLTQGPELMVGWESPATIDGHEDVNSGGVTVMLV